MAHEALFRCWAPLRQAIEASYDQLRWRADVERWAKDWESSGRQDAYLLRDERLKAAQRWACSDGEVMAGLPLMAEFLACSNRADHATMKRRSDTIARQALATVDHDPDYSLLLALTAVEECVPTASAIHALTAALVASQVRLVLCGHDNEVVGVAWSLDGRRLVTGSGDRTVWIWDTESGAETIVVGVHTEEVYGVSWSLDGKRIVSVSQGRTCRIWDATTSIEDLVTNAYRWVFRKLTVEERR